MKKHLILLILLGFLISVSAQNVDEPKTTSNTFQKEKKCNDAELVVSDGTKIYLFDYINGEYTNIKNFTGYADNSISRVKIGDATGDGYNDIVVLFRNITDSIMKFDVWSYNGSKWEYQVKAFNTNKKSSRTPLFFYGLEVGDTDGDMLGNNLVISGLEFLKFDFEIYQFQDHTFQVAQDGIGKAGPFDIIEIGDIDGDKTDEIIVASLPSRTIQIYEFRDGKYKPSYHCEVNSKITGPFDDLSVGDIDGDGDMEIIGSGASNRIEVFDFIDNELKLIYTGRNLRGLAQANTTGDFDADGRDEIIVVSGGKVYMYKLVKGKLRLIWRDNPAGRSSDLGGASSGDINGDGIDEFNVCMKDEKLKTLHHMYVYEYNGETWRNVFQYSIENPLTDLISDMGDIDNKPYVDKK